MMKNESSEYAAAVERGLEGLMFVSVGSCDAQRCSDEPSFSWSPCGICGSRLGGDRYTWHADMDGELQHYSDACVDCVMYIENGDEPESWSR